MIGFRGVRNEPYPNETGTWRSHARQKLKNWTIGKDVQSFFKPPCGAFVKRKVLSVKVKTSSTFVGVVIVWYEYRSCESYIDVSN
jgi:hypothetical protein